MKRRFALFLVCFLVTTVLVASALPTMAGRLKSYDGTTGILLLELEDKSVRTFRLTDKTKIEWMGRTTHASALRPGAKISIQVAGSLGANPLKAAAIVDWGNSEKIVAKGAAAPYHTPVAQYASTAGGGGMPDGAPKMNSSAHRDMAAIAHGGSQNQPTGPNGYSASTGLTSPANGPSQSYPAAATGPSHFPNQGVSTTAPLEMMNIDPYSSNPTYMPSADPMQMGMEYPQMGMGYDPTATLMGVDGGESQAGMYGMETAYGGGTQKITGQVLESAVEQGYVVIQSFEHPNLLRVLLHQAAAAPMQLLVPGQMIEVTGNQTPQGFRALEIGPAQGGF